MTQVATQPRNTVRKPRDILGALDNAYRRTLVRVVFIERGVPVSEIEHNKKEKYPFSLMQVGDSMLVDWEPNLTRVRCAAASAAKRLKYKFKTRRAPEGGVRIWRTE